MVLFLLYYVLARCMNTISALSFWYFCYHSTIVVLKLGGVHGHYVELCLIWGHKFAGGYLPRLPNLEEGRSQGREYHRLHVR